MKSAMILKTVILIWLGWIGLPIAHAIDYAKVEGRVISDKDLRAALGNVNDGQKASALSDPNTRRTLVNRLVDQHLLAFAAEKDKLDQLPEFKEFMESARRAWLAEKYMERRIGSKANDEAIKKYYKTNRTHYSTDRVRVQHILTTDAKKAEEILKQVKEPNTDFQEVAEKVSKDPSAKNNRGELGWIRWDSPFVKEFKEAAFLTKAGEVSGPVKTSFGYHIIRVVQREAGSQLELSDVEPRVREDLKEEIRQVVYGELRAKAKIDVDDAAIGKM